MDSFKPFHDITSDPAAYAANWQRQTNRKVIGYFCSYAPEELIVAADALPVRLGSDPLPISLADAHLQAYCCSLARQGLEAVLSGRWQFLEGAVFPHTCDTMQRLSDIWRLRAGLRFHFDVVLPVKFNSTAAQEYLVATLRQFKQDLEQSLGIQITSEKLAQSIRLYNRLRQTLLEIYELRHRQPGLLSGTDLYALMRAATVMDRADLLQQLQTIKATLLQKGLPIASPQAKRILLAGGVCYQPAIYSILEEAGAVVAWDDLCTGTRMIDGWIDEQAEPIAALAQRYWERPICPAKHQDLTSRRDRLLHLIAEKKIAGIIFLRLKFCDPHAFDYPYLKEALDRAGCPHILLEIENHLFSDAQVRTRLEAFVEMI
ncbi:MAG: 2-hydroxyacyl-CoA dehydratase family protein [candidate division KSB1 bacterium]|nr:2-hydroxyacyl-CoA dehydratase family protein [candidate division KSB1 bacterium]MDZ7340601.1 2-hydroxyacyl-CoA dehydratase family protein [candidate division KSB1 bacterium]